MIVRATYNSQIAHGIDATGVELLKVAEHAPARGGVDLKHQESRKVEYEWDVLTRADADLMAIRLRNVHGVLAEVVG